MSLTISRRQYARALCTDTRTRGAYEFTRGELQAEAAHAALNKLNRMPHVHFTNPEELASLRLEINRDDALTVFVRQEPEELKHDSP
jgi:hypothetical protein